MRVMGNKGNMLGNIKIGHRSNGRRSFGLMSPDSGHSRVRVDQGKMKRSDAPIMSKTD